MYIKNHNSGLYLGVENNLLCMTLRLGFTLKNEKRRRAENSKITSPTGEKIQIMPKTGESGSPQRVLFAQKRSVSKFQYDLPAQYQFK